MEETVENIPENEIAEHPYLKKKFVRNQRVFVFVMSALKDIGPDVMLKIIKDMRPGFNPSEWNLPLMLKIIDALSHKDLIQRILDEQAKKHLNEALDELAKAEEAFHASGTEGIDAIRWSVDTLSAIYRGKTHIAKEIMVQEVNAALAWIDTGKPAEEDVEWFAKSIQL